MSRNRTHNRTSPRFALALAGSALAVAGVIAGTAAWPAGASAQSASPAGVLRVARTGSGPHAAVALDAFAQPLQAADALAAWRPTPRQIAWVLLKSHGWSTRQYPYLNRLWIRESGWNRYARNPYSGAYGIPQALPGSKMASAGPDWRTNARTQILWGMHYIKVRYGTPYGAWRHELIYGWY